MLCCVFSVTVLVLLPGLSHKGYLQKYTKQMKNLMCNDAAAASEGKEKKKN